MILFFRNIPANTQTIDLRNHILPAMKSRFFSTFKKGRIVNINIVTIDNYDTNSMEYHGLVTIEPDRVAQKIIKILNRKPFKGVRINIREYQTRTWHNDSRIGFSPEMKALNRRQRDRRRRNVEVINNAARNAKFSSASSFHRILGS